MAREAAPSTARRSHVSICGEAPFLSQRRRHASYKSCTVAPEVASELRRPLWSVRLSCDATASGQGWSLHDSATGALLCLGAGSSATMTTIAKLWGTTHDASRLWAYRP